MRWRIKSWKTKGFAANVKELWARNHMVSTLFALLVMVLIQAVVMFINGGSFSAMFGKLGMAWLNILRNNTYAGVIALGMCFIIISGGIDLSVGSMLCALGAILMYLIEPTNGLLVGMGITGAPAYAIACVVIIAAGYVLGTLNGSLVAYGKLPPFIATLGTMKIFRSVTQQLTKNFNPKGSRRVQAHRLRQDRRAGHPPDNLLAGDSHYNAHHLQEDRLRPPDHRHRLQ